MLRKLWNRGLILVISSSSSEFIHRSPQQHQHSSCGRPCGWRSLPWNLQARYPNVCPQLQVCCTFGRRPNFHAFFSAWPTNEPLRFTVHRLQKESNSSLRETVAWLQSAYRELSLCSPKQVNAERHLESHRKVGVLPFRVLTRQLECGIFGRAQRCWICSPFWILYPTRRDCSLVERPHDRPILSFLLGLSAIQNVVCPHYYKKNMDIA